jgi:hypothetical protein
VDKFLKTVFVFDNMATDSETVRQLLETYYGSVTGGDVETAISAFHEDVEVTHVGVRYDSDLTIESALDGAHHRLAGKDAFADLLDGRVGEEDVTVTIDEISVDGDRAAFRATITDERQSVEFVGWVRIADDLIREYTVIPADFPLVTQE